MDMQQIERAMIAHLDSLTKPKGSLGKLETYAVRMAKIQGTIPPRIDKKGVYIFAGDHGITQEGVSLYPPEVTYQMVKNFLNGGAGINALARAMLWDVTAVDAGVAQEFSPQEAAGGANRLIVAKVGLGNKNFYTQDAMSPEELRRSLEGGKKIAEDAQSRGYEMVALGDMGIGNTSTAAALLIAEGFPAEQIIDRGTGIDSATLDHKRRVITEGVRRRGPFKTDLEILQKLGSFDIAMMTGFILGLEGKGIALVLDGFPVSAAAYLAYKLNPSVKDWLFAGHRSHVVGHGPVLAALGLDPIVDLDMRLGEGTGAVIGGYIVELAVRTAREMASFSKAGVSKSETDETSF